MKVFRSSDEFIKSERCTECDGSGQVFDSWERGHDFVTPKEKWVQCEECERLAKIEAYADIMLNEAKGN